MKNEKLVSIIVPIYNVEKYIERCIQSIVSQTYPNLEIILVIDGSPDQSKAICDKYAQTDNRIKVIYQENAGVAVARNKGLELANGEYIQFVDGDDSLELNAVEKAVEAIEKTDADMVFFGHTVTRYGANNIVQSVKKIEAFDSGECTTKEFLRRISRSEYGVITNWEYVYDKLYRRELIDANNIRFTPGLCHGEDSEFVFRYLKITGNIVVINDCLYNYYVKNFDSGITSSATVFRDNMYELTLDTFVKLKALLVDMGVFDKAVAAGFYHVYINEVIKLIYRFFRSDCLMTEEQKDDKLRLILQEPMLREGIGGYSVRNSSEDAKMPRLLEQGDYNKISAYASYKVKRIYESKDEKILAIIIPVYNRIQEIKNCIESIQNLRLQSVEIIIVDDNSTDGTYEYCKNIADANIKVLRTQEQMGPGGARTIGLHNANARYVYFADSDDIVLGNFVDVYQQLVDNDKRYDVVAFNYIEKREDGAERPHKYYTELIEMNGREYVCSYLDKLDMYAAWQYVFQRSFLYENEVEYPTTHRVNEDAVFTITALAYASNVLCIPQEGYLYNFNTASVTRDIPTGSIHLQGAVAFVRSSLKLYFNSTVDMIRKEAIWDCARMMLYGVYSMYNGEEEYVELIGLIEEKIVQNVKTLKEQSKDDIYIFPASEYGMKYMQKNSAQIKGFIDNNLASLTSRKMLNTGYTVETLDTLNTENVGILVYYMKKPVVNAIVQQLEQKKVQYTEAINLSADECKQWWEMNR